MSRPLVVVCGLPSSGNKLVHAHLERSGCDARLLHANPRYYGAARYGEFRQRRLEVYDLALKGRRAIRPIRRDRSAWRASNAKHGRAGWAFHPDYLASHDLLIRSLRVAGILWTVYLEDIVETRGAALDAVIRDMGLEPGDWPTEEADAAHMGPLKGSGAGPTIGGINLPPAPNERRSSPGRDSAADLV